MLENILLLLGLKVMVETKIQYDYLAVMGFYGDVRWFWQDRTPKTVSFETFARNRGVL